MNLLEALKRKKELKAEMSIAMINQDWRKVDAITAESIHITKVLNSASRY